MPNLKGYALVVLGILGCSLVGLSQTTGGGQSTVVERDAIGLNVKYDTERDKSIVSTPITLVREVAGKLEAQFPEGNRNLPSEQLFLSTFFSYANRTYVAPDHVVFGFLSLSQGATLYDHDTAAVITVDGVDLTPGKLSVIDRRPNPNMQFQDLTFWHETLELPVSTSDFVRICAGKRVAIRLGKTRFDLKDAQMKSLRRLAAEIRP